MNVLISVQAQRKPNEDNVIDEVKPVEPAELLDKKDDEVASELSEEKDAISTVLEKNAKDDKSELVLLLLY